MNWSLNSDSKKIRIGAVYLSPEGSPFSSIELFDRLEYDILNFTSGNDSYLCLLGNFNASSGILSDFTDLVGNIADSLLDYESQFIFSKNILQELGFPFDPCSNDMRTNNFGFRLMELCKAFDVHVVNGRCGVDAFVGRTTCKGISLIDYVIMPSELFSLVRKFEVMDFYH